MQSLVLDLRGNPAACSTKRWKSAETLPPRGQLVVSTEGRNNKRDRKITDRSGEFREMPLVVLVNYGSASASGNCFRLPSGDCAALGKCKAIVIGENFRQRPVQEIMPLEGAPPCD